MEQMKNTFQYDYKREIPSTWEMRKMRQVFSFRKGLSITKEDLVIIV